MKSRSVLVATATVHEIHSQNMNSTHLPSPKQTHPKTTLVFPRFPRRRFLQTISGLAASAFGAMLARADDLPRNSNPRAIFGDVVEPDWKHRVTISVGPKPSKLVGSTIASRCEV